MHKKLTLIAIKTNFTHNNLKDKFCMKKAI